MSFFSNLVTNTENGIGNFFNKLGTATNFQRPNTPGLMALPSNPATPNTPSNPSLFNKVTTPAVTPTGNRTPAVAQVSYSGGQNMPAAGSPEYIKAQGMSTQNNTGGNTGTNTGSTGSVTTSTTPSLWQSTVGKTANTTVTPETSTAISGLQGIAQNQTPQVTEAQNEYNQFAKASPFLLSDVRNNPNVAAEVSVGRGQALGQTLSAEQQALQGNVANALQGEQQQITAGQQAGGLANTGQQNVLSGQATGISATQPQLGQYGQTYYSPQTAGQGGGTIQLTGQPANDVSSLVQSVLNNNIDYNTAYSQLSGAYGGPVANQLLQQIKAQNPNFNPTAQSATTQAVAGQNASQGSQYQGLATQLGTNVATISAQAPLLIDAIKSAGLNTAGNSTLNQLMSSGLAQTNPGAVTAVQTYTQEINTAIQQLIGRGGITPTDIGLQAGNLDISNIPISQLQSVLDNLEKAGKTTQSVYQKIADSSYGSPTTGAYMGGKANPSTTATPVKAQQIQPNTIGADNNIVIGAGSNLVGGMWNSVKNLGGELIGFLSRI